MTDWAAQRALIQIAAQTWYQVQQLLHPSLREQARAVTDAFLALQSATTYRGLDEAERKRR